MTKTRMTPTQRKIMALAACYESDGITAAADPDGTVTISIGGVSTCRDGKVDGDGYVVYGCEFFTVDSLPDAREVLAGARS